MKADESLVDCTAKSVLPYPVIPQCRMDGVCETRSADHRRTHCGAQFTWLTSQGTIHITARGEAVRSKSEVIIANLLHSEKIDYHYESPLEIYGVTKYPDFTIEDDDTGKKYYWEHCGMLGDVVYKRRWERKKAWYRDQQILPYQEGGGKGRHPHRHRRPA